MLTTGTLYDEPGPDYYTRRSPERAKNHAIHRLQALGYDVTLQPRRAACLTHLRVSQSRSRETSRRKASPPAGIGNQNVTSR